MTQAFSLRRQALSGKSQNVMDIMIPSPKAMRVSTIGRAALARRVAALLACGCVALRVTERDGYAPLLAPCHKPKSSATNCVLSHGLVSRWNDASETGGTPGPGAAGGRPDLLQRAQSEQRIGGPEGAPKWRRKTPAVTGGWHRTRIPTESRRLGAAFLSVGNPRAGQIIRWLTPESTIYPAADSIEGIQV